MTEYDWPVAEFDPIRRLRVIAASNPGTSIRETVMAAPLAAVWAVASDLEGELPQWLFPDIATMRVTPATGAVGRWARPRCHCRGADVHNLGSCP